MKALLWEGDGFVLLYKRLENGNFKWPRQESEVRPINWQEYLYLFHESLILGRIFNKLYELILRKIETNIEISFYYYNVLEFNVPDYVMVSREDFYEIWQSIFWYSY